MPSTRSTVLEVIHTLSLAIWLSMLVAAAVGASHVFPAMREAHATVPGYPAYPAESWRLVGGLAASPIFFFTSHVQSICGLVAALSFIGVLAVRGVALMSVVGVLRLLTLIAACATLTYYTHSYIPDMHAQLDTLLAASADPTQADAAKAAQATFDTSHRLGTPLISAMGILVLLGLALVPVSRPRAALITP